jgi:ATP-dependent DNA helicase RecG
MAINLKDPISFIPYIGGFQAKKLEKLGIKSIEDLLFYIPYRYDDFSDIVIIADLHVGQMATIKGEVLSFKNQYSRSGKKVQFAQIWDGTGKVLAVWFNQPFLARALHPGVKVALSGTLGWWAKNKAMYSPEYEIVDENKEQLHTGRLVPVYPLTQGISAKWMRNRIHYILSQIEPLELPEFLPEEFLEGLPQLFQAIQSIHYPSNLQEAFVARKRLALNELLHLQIQSMYRRIEWQKNEVAKKLALHPSDLRDFINHLPFVLTQSQQRAIQEIQTDLNKPHPMNRLLEGDVGSGKTVVAAVAAFIATKNNTESVFMAPTQILTQQHYQTLNQLFSSTNIGIRLVTSAGVVENGKPISIHVGTHALIHSQVNLENVSLVVIDEQHRFGVEQRANLITKSTKKQIAPHVLTMTATPIPRTIALTLYGELDLSVLNELPKGRLAITTWIVPPHKRSGAYEWIEEQIKQQNAQVFVVCPLIEESESETLKDVKAAKKEYENLQKIFIKRKVALLHGRMKPKEKAAILNSFRKSEIDILVTTPVVEVGVDIPNATIMLIEAAERFGLAQLHQLRGRVGRGGKKSYCLLFTDSQNDEVTKRLNALRETHSGFELAEIDLTLRGPGEILGTRQHGISELRIASWQDRELIQYSRNVATKIWDDPEKYKSVLEWFKQKQIANN